MFLLFIHARLSGSETGVIQIARRHIHKTNGNSKIPFNLVGTIPVLCYRRCDNFFVVRRFRDHLQHFATFCSVLRRFAVFIDHFLLEVGPDHKIWDGSGTDPGRTRPDLGRTRDGSNIRIRPILDFCSRPWGTVCTYYVPYLTSY